MTGRILDHAPIAIPNSATKERESSHPRTTGFSCVAPGEAVLIDQNVDFYSFDFLSAVDTTVSTGRRRPAGPTVRYEDGGIGLVAAGHPPPTEKIDHKALPKTKAIPPSEAGIHRREGYSCQQSNRAPLHAAVAHAPYRHDNLVKHLTR